MSLHARAIGHSGKLTLCHEGDIYESRGAIGVKSAAEKENGFFGAGLAQATEEQNSAEGAKHFRNLFAIGKRDNVPDEDAPEVHVKAGRQVKGKSEAVFALPRNVGMHGKLQFSVLYLLALFPE